MPKSIISEGKTSTEAIEKGLKQLHVSKDKVDIKILENEEKRSFFSILAPRVVKVELTLKENQKENKKEAKTEQKEYVAKEKKYFLADEEKKVAKENLAHFLEEFSKNMENLQYQMEDDKEYIHVELLGEGANHLIGYRGETLNAMQIILSSIASKGLNTKAHVILNIANYREKREKALEELADKLSKTVVKTGKQVTLEPMSAYERKIIHNRLQNSEIVKTYSIGEEPYRKVVITKK